MRRLLFACVLVACRPSNIAENNAAFDIADVYVPPIAVAAREASAPDAGVEPPAQVAFAADGTLVVVFPSQLLARAKDGTIARAPLTKDAFVEASAAAQGVIVKHGDDATLLATPTLKELASGRAGESPMLSGAIVLGPEVVMQRGGGALRLAVSEAARVERVDPVANGARIVVTWMEDTDGGDSIQVARLYDAQSGAVVGPIAPMPVMSGMIPVSGANQTALFAIDGKKLTRTSLLTGKIERTTTVRCGKDQDLGNPTPNASGDLLLYTCNGDGVVLDGASFAEKRRISRIIPGCDNGPILGGVILADGHTMLLEGCGGEAKLDLATGKFTCADGAGLLGAPYMVMVPMPMPISRPGGPPVPVAPAAPSLPRAPPGRENVPRCTPDGEIGMRTSLGTTHKYVLVHGEHLVVRSDAGTIDLGDDSTYPVIAPDESILAYPQGPRVILRALPSGAIVGAIDASTR
ncbi:MAG TPA: hypothetical protein VIF62_10240 [Labilithrix sp.]|jgi:hypothetical protein